MAVTGFFGEVEIGLEAVAAVVEAVLVERASVTYYEQFDIATVNGSLRALPAKWGIDRFMLCLFQSLTFYRFPCTRRSPLDLFREGDFDYPFALRQVEEMATALYDFLYLDAFQYWTYSSTCLERHLIQPVRESLFHLLHDTKRYRCLFR